MMVCDDIATLLDGLAYRGAITDPVINKKIWISRNMEFNTIFELDRIARFLVRSKKTKDSFNESACRNFPKLPKRIYLNLYLLQAPQLHHGSLTHLS